MTFNESWHVELRRKEQERRTAEGLPPATERELRRLFRAADRLYDRQLRGLKYVKSQDEVTIDQLREENEALRARLKAQKE